MLQARVIEIYEKTGFASLALEAKKEYVARYGVAQRVPPGQPRGLGQGAAAGQDPPRRAGAPLPRERAEDQGQRRLPGGGALVPRVPGRPSPTTRTAPQNNFLLAELLYEDKRFADAASSTRRRPTTTRRMRKSADAGYAALLAYAQQQKQAPAGRRCRRCSGRASTAPCASPRPSPTDPRTGPVLTNAADKLYAPEATARRRRRWRSRCSTLQPPAAETQRRVAWTVVAHTSFEAGAFDQAEKRYAEVLTLDARERRRAQRPGRAPGRVDLQAGRAGARRRRDARRRRPLRARRRGRAAIDRARDGAVRRRGGADRAEGLGRRDPHAGGLPHPLPEPPAAGRGQRQARRRLPGEGPVGAAPPASSSASATTQRRPEDRPRRAVAGRRAVREGRLAAERDQGLRALPAPSTRSRSSRRSRRASGSPSSPRPTATPRARRR